MRTRLDMFIDRMVSQRACLDVAIAATADMAGPVFELGLGNGRTYHHLRSRIDERDIFVFDREMGAHPDSIPPGDRMVLGDVMHTLPVMLTRKGAAARLIHADLGGHDPDCNDRLARKVSPLIEPLLAPGGMMVSSDRMYFEHLVDLPLPAEAVPGQCFLYQKPVD